MISYFTSPIHFFFFWTVIFYYFISEGLTCPWYHVNSMKTTFTIYTLIPFTVQQYQQIILWRFPVMFVVAFRPTRIHILPSKTLPWSYSCKLMNVKVTQTTNKKDLLTIGLLLISDVKKVGVQNC